MLVNVFNFMNEDAQQNGDLRLASELVGVPMGRVEIFLDRQWGTLRFNDKSHFSEQQGAAQAICRQLGYYDQLKVGNVTNFKYM